MIVESRLGRLEDSDKVVGVHKRFCEVEVLVTSGRRVDSVGGTRLCCLVTH